MFEGQISQGFEERTAVQNFSIFAKADSSVGEQGLATSKDETERSNDNGG